MHGADAFCLIQLMLYHAAERSVMYFTASEKTYLLFVSIALGIHLSVVHEIHRYFYSHFNLNLHWVG